MSIFTFRIWPKEKHWVSDLQGVAWECFHTLESAVPERLHKATPRPVWIDAGHRRIHHESCTWACLSGS